jgi:hypothetical protein
MSQYQLVAAAAEIPATKLLGTTPKGFNATGEYEEASYHETLESLQEHYATPFLERHHQLVLLSKGIRDTETTIAWNPVDSPTAKEYAEIRKLNAETDVMLADAGVIEATEIRQKLQDDENSGFTNLEDAAGEESGDIGALKDQLEGLAAGFGMDAEPKEWITPNGARIPLDKDGEPTGKVGEKIKESSVEVRKASNFSEAREAAKSFVGKPLTNGETGMVATVSRNSLDKMLSGSAAEKSESPSVHSLAVANADSLFKNARHGESNKDRNSDTNIVAIHRFYAPLESGSNKYSVKLTVKELAQSGNRIYTVEAVDVRNAPASIKTGKPGGSG